MTTYILTSDTAPADPFILSEADGQQKAGLAHRINLPKGYVLTEVDDWMSYTKVPITTTTRYVAFLKGDGKWFDGNDYRWGFVGEIRKLGPGGGDVVGADGGSIFTFEDEDCPRIWPPEMFGLNRAPWWETVFK